MAFDGDFDRCFLFDHKGNFIPGEYLVGLLSQIFLNKEKGATIIHDPRVIWNTIDVVTKCGGKAVVSKTGHAFVKTAMRHSDAIYGGEMSAHHYFKDFAYCDSGMIPWLLVWEYLSKSNRSMSDLISERKEIVTRVVKLKDRDQIVLTYVGNPNGSVCNIAGVLSDNRRVIGMMPHPERCCDPIIGGTDGNFIFGSLVDHIGEKA